MNLLTKSLLVFLLCLNSITSFAIDKNKNASRDFYLIQVYHCSSSDQIVKIDQYLKNTYLPLLHQIGIEKVGVFEPINNDSSIDKTLMVWIPLSSLTQLDKIDAAMERLDPLGNDPLLQLKNADGSIPYNRIETTLSKAFKGQPNFEKNVNLTKTAKRIFEYRSYEGRDESQFLKKVHMFNEGKEIGLFKRLNFNALFYAKVIAGSSMPNLIYITSFNTIEDRNKHWDTFGNDPYWKKIVALPIYQNTVSKADIVLMYAKDYADF